MASGFNRVILMGNLTRDPEIRYTPSGTAVLDMRLAVTTRMKRGDDWGEDTVFVDVTVWDRQAENCNKYLSKGRPVLIEGRLKMDEWTDKESGKKRSKITVTARTVQFLGSSDGGGRRDSGESKAPRDEDNPGREEGLDEFPAKDDVPF